MLDENQFENVTKYIYELENKAVEEILSGYINPSPLVKKNYSPCDFCDYRWVCGIEKTNNPERRKIIKNIDFNNFI